MALKRWRGGKSRHVRQPPKAKCRPAFTGTATQPYSATEVDGWQHKLSRVSQNRAAVHPGGSTVAGSSNSSVTYSPLPPPLRCLRLSPGIGLA